MADFDGNAAAVSGEGLVAEQGEQKPSGSEAEEQADQQQSGEQSSSEEEGVVFEVEVEEEEGEDDKASTEEEGDEGKAGHKLSANERIQQLINENKELKSKLPQEPQNRQEEPGEQEPQPQQPQLPQYIEVDEDKFKGHVSELKEQANELELEGKDIEARRVRRNIDQLYDAFDLNEQNRKEAMRLRQQQSQAQVKQQEFVKEFDRVAEQYRETYGIPKDIWDSGAQQLAQKMEKDPMLAREFQEIVKSSGMVSGLRWAQKQLEDGLGGQAEDTLNQRESAKNKQFGGKGGGGKSVTIKSFEDVMKLPSKEIVRFKKENPQVYAKLHRAALK